MQTEKRASSQGATWGLGVLFGVVGASIQQSVGGFVIGAVVGALCAQILFLRTRTESLEKQIRELTQRLAGLKAAPEERAAPTPRPRLQPPRHLHRRRNQRWRRARRLRKRQLRDLLPRYSISHCRR